MKLYDDPTSGNGYKLRLLLAQLGLRYEYVPVDILKAETRTPEFLRRNPNGRIPVLELDDGSFLAESDAILYYLAQGTPMWPVDRLEQAQTLQWMFFEQYSHEPNVATPRYWVALRGTPLSPFEREWLEVKRRAGHAALRVMEQHLAGRRFFVGERYGLADIALYAYTHVAPEGGLELSAYPAVLAWLERVRNQPGHVKIGD